MYLRHHLLSCVILTLVLFPFFSYYSLLVFIFGFFIDVDHYLYDAIRHKDFNLIRSYKRNMDKYLVRKNLIHVFHTIEFIIPFILLTIISRNIYLILLSSGLILHLILDFIYEIYLIMNNIEMKQTRNYSLISWIINHS